MIKNLMTKIACRQKFFKREYILLVDNTFEDNAELCDNYALFEYLQTKPEFKDISFYIVNKCNKQYEEIKKKYPNNIIPTFQSVVNQKLINKLFKTKYWLDSFQVINRYNCNIKKYMQKSDIITVYTQHGINFMKTSYVERSKEIGDETFKKIVYTNEQERTSLKKQYGYDDRNTIIAGLSRWDNINYSQNNAEKTIFIYFTFREYLVKYKGTKIELTNYIKNLINLCTSERLSEILQKYNVKLNIAVHHVTSHFIKDLKLPNITLIDEKDIGKIKTKTSLFITDFSSMCFDFMFKDIPVIFYRLDYKDSLLAINWGDRVNQEFSEAQNDKIYNVFYDKENVINKIEEYCKNNFQLEEEYKAKNSTFFAYRDNIRQHIIEGILASPTGIPNDCDRIPYENIEFNKVYNFSDDLLPAISTEDLDYPTNNGRLTVGKTARMWFILPEKKPCEVILKLASCCATKKKKHSFDIFLNDKFVETAELDNCSPIKLKLTIDKTDSERKVQKIVFKRKKPRELNLNFYNMTVKTNSQE